MSIFFSNFFSGIMVSVSGVIGISVVIVSLRMVFFVKGKRCMVCMILRLLFRLVSDWMLLLLMSGLLIGVLLCSYLVLNLWMYCWVRVLYLWFFFSFVCKSWGVNISSGMSIKYWIKIMRMIILILKLGSEVLRWKMWLVSRLVSVVLCVIVKGVKLLIVWVRNFRLLVWFGCVGMRFNLMCDIC